MSTLTCRGDAPAVAKQILLREPTDYVAGTIELKVGNKVVTIGSWDASQIADAWNNSGYPEMSGLATASAISSGSSAYGTSTSAVLFTANVPGTDFFFEAFINNSNTIGTNEIQRLTFNPIPSGGTFTLSFNGETTGSITYVADDPSTTAANILAALIALTGISSGDVEVSYVSSSMFYVTFTGAYAGTDVPQMTCSYTGLTGGDVTLTVSVLQVGVLPTDEVQTISLSSAPTGGTFTLTFGGYTTTAIAYNANAATVQAALEALTSIGSGGVVCSGGAFPGTPIVVTFAGTLAGQPQDLITGNGSLLTGTSANITGVGTVRAVGTGVNMKKAFAFGSGSAGSTTYGRWGIRKPDGTLVLSDVFDRTTATNASLKTLLLTLADDYSYDESYPIWDKVAYTLTSSDIDITGDINDIWDGSSGGILVELKGNLAQHETGMSATINRIELYGCDAAGTYTYDIYGTNTRSTFSGNPTVYQTEAWEIQSYTVSDITRPGGYKINVYDSAGAVHHTALIPYSVTSYLTIQAAVNAALGGNYVAVERVIVSSTSYTWKLHYRNYGYQIVNMTELTIDESYSVSITETVQGDIGVSDIQQISASYTEPIRSGSFTLEFEGQVTSAIAYDGIASTAEAALVALSTVALGDLTVTGGPIKDSPFDVTFIPSKGEASELIAVSSLNNSKLVVTTYVGGGIVIESEEITRNSGPNCFDTAANYDPQQVPSDGDTVVFEFGTADILYGIKQRDTFTVDSLSKNTLQLSSKRWLFQDGQKLLVLSSGTAPAGLTSGTAYYVISSDGLGKFQLSTTAGGSAINITDAGTGTHTIGLHLTALVKPSRFIYAIGLARTGLGFEEFRPRYLESWIDTLTLGEGSGTDSQLTRFDLGTKQSDVTVYNTGASIESNVPTVGILANCNTTDLTTYGGSVGLGLFLDESCVVRNIKANSTRLYSVGGTTCTSLKADRNSSVVGSFTPSTVSLGS